MAEKSETKQPPHKVYSVIKREGQDDWWLNLGLVFPHKDGKGFTIFTDAWPHDGKLVCREITEKNEAEAGDQSGKVSRIKPQERRTTSSR